MKHKRALWAAGLGLFTVTLLPLTFHGQPGPPQPATALATPRATPADPSPQRHPRVEAAIRHLEEARQELEAAQGEFHGHRVRALGHVKQAIEECHRALESDR
jgi:hypothetical protein